MGPFLSALGAGESKSGFWDVATPSLTYQLLKRTVCSVSAGSAWDHAGISFVYSILPGHWFRKKKCGRVQDRILVTGNLILNIMRE